MMRFSVITIFPELFESFRKVGLFGKAIEQGLVQLECVNPRDFTDNKHRTVDDAPYGGGSGMVMRVEPIVQALESTQARSAAEEKVHRVLLGPRGKPFTQNDAQRLSQTAHIAWVCGRYEGIDERVHEFIDEEYSLGDFVLTGGEVAAMCLMEAVARLRPGFMGNETSIEEESHAQGLLEYPHYTRPPLFRGQGVPEVLLSGHHEAIRLWRRQEALRITHAKRPELLERTQLSEAEKTFLRTLTTKRNE